MGHMGNEPTWGMGHMGNGVQGYGAHWQWGTWVMGHMGDGAPEHNNT